MTDMTSEQPARRPEGADSPVLITVLLLSLVGLVVLGVTMNRHEGNLPLWTSILGVLATVSIFTILYRENPLFRFVEHLYVGLATGYSFILIWVVFIQPRWLLPMLPSSLAGSAGEGKWWFFFAFLLGLLFFTVYAPRISWMNRFAVSVLMGWAAGAALQAFFGMIGPQLVAAMKATPVSRYEPAVASAGNNFHLFGLWWHPLSLLALIVLLCTFAYFFFSVEHRSSWVRTPSRAGRYFLMITLGAIFGTTVMGRLSLVIERLGYLMYSLQNIWHAIFR